MLRILIAGSFPLSSDGQFFDPHAFGRHKWRKNLYLFQLSLVPILFRYYGDVRAASLDDLLISAEIVSPSKPGQPNDHSSAA